MHVDTGKSDDGKKDDRLRNGANAGADGLA
jgi:hypothetical protein